MVKSINKFQRRLQRLLFFIGSSARFYLNARTIHGIDSPYLYDLMQSVLEKPVAKTIIGAIAQRRKELYNNEHIIHRLDFGQGSHHHPNDAPNRKISSWAKTSSIDPYFGKVLHQIVAFIQPKIILELGTAAGISGAYMASGYSGCRLITIEGDPSAAGIARQTFDRLNQDVQIEIGTFSEVLPQLFKKQPFIDLAFIDGHHLGPALLQYAELIQAHLHPGFGVLIVDDIRWSADMYQAWCILKSDVHWTACLDLYRFGILIHNTDLLDKLDVKLIARKYKFWTLGLVR